MIKKFFSLFLLTLFTSIGAQTWHNNDEYIQQFAPLAVREMELFHIPASITLAQGILETGGGQSRLAQQGNNHFGIKCKKNWTGRSLRHTDDAPNECFRAYDSVKDSYRDHSLFLAKRPYYRNLFKLDPKDYEAWAHGLKKAGYATNPRYARLLINYIEKYKLYEFDYANSQDVYAILINMYPQLKSDTQFMAKVNPAYKEGLQASVKVPDTHNKVAQENKADKIREELETHTPQEILNEIFVQNHPNKGLMYIVIPEPIELSYISAKYGVPMERLMKYNELKSTLLEKNDIVFLERKRPRGIKRTYTAEAGESMHDIAQKFAIRLDKLYHRNRMTAGQQPVAGQIIYLRGRKPRN